MFLLSAKIVEVTDDDNIKLIWLDLK